MAKKQNSILIFILASVISLFIAWYVLDSLMLAFAYVILVCLGVFDIINRSSIDNKKYRNISDAYNFVNLMNVQMISTNSVYEAYKSVENYISIDFANIANEDLHTQLLDIANEYDISSFKMYINTLIIYDTDGGNYKEMQIIPTSLCQKSKVYYNKLKKNKTIKLIEMTTLYLLWICVCFFIKFSISSFYSSMMENIIYQMIIFIILLVGSFFYYISIREYFNNKIRGL